MWQGYKVEIENVCGKQLWLFFYVIRIYIDEYKQVVEKFKILNGK